MLITTTLQFYQDQISTCLSSSTNVVVLLWRRCAPCAWQSLGLMPSELVRTMLVLCLTYYSHYEHEPIRCIPLIGKVLNINSITTFHRFYKIHKQVFDKYLLIEEKRLWFNHLMHKCVKKHFKNLSHSSKLDRLKLLVCFTGGGIVIPH